MGRIYSIRYKNIKDVKRALIKGATFTNGTIDKSFLKDGYVYCASPGAISVLAKYLTHIASDERGALIGINNIIQNVLLKDWFSPVTHFEQYLWLGKTLDGLKQKLSVELHTAMKKNRKYILDACRLLAEMGYSLTQWQPKDETLATFKEIYKLFLQEEHYLKFCKNVNCWSNKEDFLDLLQNSTISQGSFKKVYFQGFYYITPIQLRFMKAFLNAGFDMCFLYNYNEEAKEAYTIWDSNVFVKKIADVYDLESKDACAPYFTSIYGSRNNEHAELENKPRIIEFEDVFAFVKYVDECGLNNLQVISSAKEMEEILDLYFPDQSTKKHFLSYPIGQYIFSLYNIWNPLKQDKDLSVDNVRHCLATGWANKRAENTGRLLEIFDKISIYFTDCTSLQDWEERCEHLKYIHENIMPCFRSKGSTGSRWEELRDNPLLLCGPFSLKTEDINTILGVIHDIVDDAKLLFKDGNSVDLVKHFNKIAAIIKDKNSYNAVGDRSALLEDERIIVEEIISRINSSATSPSVNKIKNCTMDDFAEAMHLFLDGTHKDEEEITSKNRLNQLSQIEGLLSEKGSIMLGFCDDKHLPGKEKEYKWPLEKEVLQEIAIANATSVQDMAEVYINAQDSVCYQNRYLFFTALQIENIQLAYIKKLGDQDYSMSPYLKVLNKAPKYSVRIENFDEVEKLENINEDEHIKVEDCYRSELYEVTDVNAMIYSPGELTLNKRCCCWLNTYDYILANNPVFTSKFHLGFYASILIRFVNQLGEWDAKVGMAKKMVFYLLPFWNYAEQEERYSFSKGKKGLYNSYKGIDLKEDESKNHLLRYGLKYLNIKNVKYLLGRKKENPDFGKSGVECIYCPHGDKCFARYRDHINVEDEKNG